MTVALQLSSSCSQWGFVLNSEEDFFKKKYSSVHNECYWISRDEHYYSQFSMFQYSTKRSVLSTKTLFVSSSSTTGLSHNLTESFERLQQPIDTNSEQSWKYSDYTNLWRKGNRCWFLALEIIIVQIGGLILAQNRSAWKWPKGKDDLPLALMVCAQPMKGLSTATAMTMFTIVWTVWVRARSPYTFTLLGVTASAMTMLAVVRAVCITALADPNQRITIW